MTYAQFLLLFLIGPLACIVVIGRRQISLALLIILGVISVVAIAYTGPWDSAIIANGVWSYGAHQVSGILIGGVPLEEYGFYVLQTFLVGLATAIVLNRRGN